MLATGKVLVAGGFNANKHTATAELYDSVSNTWSTTSPLIVARHLHTATLLPNGKLVAEGGVVDSNSLPSAEIYDFTNDTWTASGLTLDKRYSHTATLHPNGSLILIGGLDTNGIVGTVQEAGTH